MREVALLTGQHALLPLLYPLPHSQVSMACTSLCLWARAIYKYNDVALTIAPKKAKLAEAEAQLASAQKVLGEKRAALAAVVAKVAQLKAQYTASLAKKDELAKSQKTTAARLERAVKLTGGLADEAVRWKAAAAQLELDMVNLVGNMLVSSSCIAYLGAFTANFRTDLVASWVGVARDLTVPVDGAFSLVRLLADPVVVREWNAMGLPADDFSTENGLFSTLGRRWPLMIDPQLQGQTWIRQC